MSKLIRKKVARLAKGATPGVVDLFCGAGGFSLGFERAGFRVLGGVELDKHAAHTHAANFHGHLEGSPEYEEHRKPRDIRKTEPLAWLRKIGVKSGAEAVDVLIGGPPCPAYTRVGRAKLREVAKDPRAHKNDSRATLYIPYLEWVRALEPVALVMENVPDILNFGGHNLGEEICEVLGEMGYQCQYTLLNSASFEVPQMRPRFILVGVHREVGNTWEWPVPARRVDLPIGYALAESAALKPLREGVGLQGGHYVPLADAPKDSKPAVTAEQALSDLPVLTSHLEVLVKRGAKPPDQTSQMPYSRLSAPSAWVRDHMLGWDGREVKNGSPVQGHLIRALGMRDFRIFEGLQPGDQYPEAYALGLRLFDEYIGRLRKLAGPLPDELAEATRVSGLIAGFIEVLSRLPLVERGWRSRLRTASYLWKELGDYIPTLDARAEAWEASVQGDPPDLDAPDRFLPGARETYHGDVARLLEHLSRGTHDVLHERVLADLQGVYRTAKKIQRRRQNWRDGLDRLGLNNRHRNDWGLAVSIPGWLPKPDSVSERLSAKLDGGRFKPEGALSYLIVDLIVLRAVRLSQNLGVYLPLKRYFVPPYVPDKFPNKWRKMEADLPARTLLAHLGKDSYSHIHYDSAQARPISIREAARLQSFPDSFQFKGTMNPAFRQVGNAVPPLMAWYLGRALLESLRST